MKLQAQRLLPGGVRLFACVLASLISVGMAQADEPRRLSFDDVKFDIERNADYDAALLTDEIRGLDGQRVRISGYIRPSVKQSGIQRFIFVRDNQECCFGPGAMIYDCMIVTLASGNETEFTTRAITVEGTFYIKEFIGPDDRIWAVFRMKDAEVR